MKSDIMAINKAIAHAREVAEKNRKQYKNCPADLLIKKPYTSEECAEEHEQLAEWLEELKAVKSDKTTDYLLQMSYADGYRKAENDYYSQSEKDRQSSYDCGCEFGYNKAIDDFMTNLLDHCMQQENECYKLECPFCTDDCDIVNIAEQLKR